MSLSARNADSRVRFAVNSGAPYGPCDAAWQFTGAVVASCLAVQGLTPPPDPSTTAPLPDNFQLTSPSDLDRLSNWVTNRMQVAYGVMQNSYVEDIPMTVVAAAEGVGGALSGLGGAAGQDVTNAANALIGINTSWGLVLGDAQTLATDIRAVQLQIDETENTQTINAL
jgi:hypothetical protein